MKKGKAILYKDYQQKQNINKTPEPQEKMLASEDFYKKYKRKKSITGAIANVFNILLILVIIFLIVGYFFNQDIQSKIIDGLTALKNIK